VRRKANLKSENLAGTGSTVVAGDDVARYAAVLAGGRDSTA
jgi:hypothetical protein